MARRNSTATTSHNATRGEAQFLEFSNSSDSPEVLRQRATVFLANKDLVQNVRGLTSQDQARFVDKVDQVR